MYLLGIIVYFVVYLPMWLCLGRPGLGILCALLAVAAWDMIADWYYGHTWFWFTGLRKKTWRTGRPRGWS